MNSCLRRRISIFVRWPAVPALAMALSLFSCSDEINEIIVESSVAIPASVTILGPDTLYAQVGQPLSDILTAQVLSSEEHPVSDVSVFFRVTEGEGSLDIVETSQVTDGNGVAWARARGRSETGVAIVQVHVPGVGSPEFVIIVDTVANIEPEIEGLDVVGFLEVPWEEQYFGEANGSYLHTPVSGGDQLWIPLGRRASGFLRVDATDPQNLSTVSHEAWTVTASVAWQDGRVYLIGRDSLYIAAVEGDALVRKGTIAVSSGIQIHSKVRVDGSRIVIGGGVGAPSLRVYDMSAAPDAPELIFESSENGGVGMDANDGIAVIANEVSGVRVYRYDEDPPRLIATAGTVGRARDVRLLDGICYVFNHRYRTAPSIAVFDMANAEQPILTHVEGLPLSVYYEHGGDHWYGMERARDYFFVGSTGGMVVLDASDQFVPRLIGVIHRNAAVAGMVKRDQYVMATSRMGITTYEVQ